MKTLLVAAVVSLALVTAAGAQTRPTPSPAAPAPQVAPAPPAVPPAPAAARAPRPQTAPAPVAAARAPVVAVPERPPVPDPPNVRFDIAITDEGGSATPARKDLVVVVQGNGKASLRSTGLVSAQENPTLKPIMLNIDVTTFGTTDPNKVGSRIMVEYQPYVPNAEFQPASVRAQVDVRLDSGKKMQVWQTADPVSDRRTSIEVTATIIK